LETIFMNCAKKRAVVVGLGIGMAHARAYMESDYACLYGVSELNPVRLSKVGGTFSEGNMICLRPLFPDEMLDRRWEDLGVKVFPSLDAVLADPDVDIVSICTPDYLHPEHLRKAMASGKDILLEKPLAITLDEARSIEPEIRSYGHDFAIAYEFRSIPPVVQLRNLVQSGELGDVKAFSLYHFRTPFKRDKWNHWIQKRACSGGLLVEETCHWFDLARFITGKEIDSVSCVTEGGINEGFDFEDIAYVNGRYKDGGVFQISHALTGFDFSLQLTVHGTKKVAWCNFKETESSSLDAGQTDYYAVVSVGPVGGGVEDASVTTYGLEATEPWAIKEQVLNYCREAALGKPHGAGVDDGMKSLEAALCSEESARTGAAVKLS
jgi:predicted dehydrogenase